MTDNGGKRHSVLGRLSFLPAKERAKLLETLSAEQLATLKEHWQFTARPDQMAPEGDWLVWVLLGGRGGGKTRTGSEWVHDRVEGGARQIALIARRPGDVRDVMVEGLSGLARTQRKNNPIEYRPSLRKVKWANGAEAITYSSWEPEDLRGPGFDTVWCDELGKWKKPKETWENLELAVRVGDIRICVTTTPRPIPTLRRILKDPTTRVTHCTTYDNRANLSPGFFYKIVRRYEGTTLGRQEIMGELLEEIEGALWNKDMIDPYRIGEDGRWQSVPSRYDRIVVAIDPAGKSDETASETGIVAVARLREDFFVLGDHSGHFTPDGWATRAIGAFQALEADRIIGEVNNGGEMVEHTLRTVDRDIPFKAIHATRGKDKRAEPIVALYQQGRIHHAGTFPELEDQMVTWVPGEGGASPDRMDALVWAIRALMHQRERVEISPGAMAGLEFDDPFRAP